jgi:hypothetical protein
MLQINEAFIHSLLLSHEMVAGTAWELIAHFTDEKTEVNRDEITYSM